MTDKTDPLLTHIRTCMRSTARLDGPVFLHSANGLCEFATETGKSVRPCPRTITVRSWHAHRRLYLPKCFRIAADRSRAAFCMHIRRTIDVRIVQVYARMHLLQFECDSLEPM